MIFKDFSENELYLLMNGKLIYKRWLDTGVSKVFDVMAYDKYTLASIKELGNENGLFIVKARVKLEYTPEGKLQQTYLSDIYFEGESLIPDE
ncbi:hypothetical protein KUH03_01750 [Sphingobacterium sp. E70]|uniref:hypothetical protein n=1 Tax=Sphingobacterium sp. E70 TaxID=2853439 RepID=UPI00211C0CBE|nr:hypothetical protein [Sphingobacterium sp. E70]ULT25748.1 hypothetical protein KUH03_01750 [Sphingobacterium sp. E70]